MTRFHHMGMHRAAILKPSEPVTIAHVGTACGDQAAELGTNNP